VGVLSVCEGSSPGVLVSGGVALFPFFSQLPFRCVDGPGVPSWLFFSAWCLMDLEGGGFSVFGLSPRRWCRGVPSLTGCPVPRSSVRPLAAPPVFLFFSPPCTGYNKCVEVVLCALARRLGLVLFTQSS